MLTLIVLNDKVVLNYGTKTISKIKNLLLLFLIIRLKGLMRNP